MPLQEIRTTKTLEISFQSKHHPPPPSTTTPICWTKIHFGSKRCLLCHPICIPNLDLGTKQCRKNKLSWSDARDFFFSHSFNVAARGFHFCSSTRDLGALIPLWKATSRQTHEFLTATLDGQTIDIEGLRVAKALSDQQHICFVVLYFKCLSFCFSSILISCWPPFKCCFASVWSVLLTNTCNKLTLLYLWLPCCAVAVFSNLEC